MLVELHIFSRFFGAFSDSEIFEMPAVKRGIQKGIVRLN